MKKKSLAGAVIAVAVALLVAIPASLASAVGYGGTGTNVTLQVGQTGVMTFVFDDEGTVGTNAVATAGDPVTIAVLRAGTATKVVDANRTVAFTVSANAAGTYPVNVVANGDIATATLTVTPADSGGVADGLSGTGVDLPMLLIWGSVGALVLGAALVLTLRATRRSGQGS